MKKNNKIHNKPEFGTWYSVKDNILPPLDKEVIVCRENQGYSFSAYRKKFNDGWYFTNAIWNWMPIEGDITHWMPMPEGYTRKDV